MLSRFLALAAALLLACASADAHAYASSLQPENARQGSLEVQANRTQELDALSADRAKEKSASAYDCTSRQTLGEQFDANLGFYNLRARYMDPRIGRFTQKDGFIGKSHAPASLNKYLYAEADPIGLSDPSGYLAGDPNDSLLALRVNAELQRIAASTGGTIGARVIVRVAIVTAIIIAKAVNEISGNPGRRDLPTIWFGTADTGKAAEHYAEAINAKELPSVLTYTRAAAARPQWYRYKDECKDKATLELHTECDEYPFGKTREGGPSNYDRGAVSLKAIPEGDNGVAGTRFSQFLSGAGCGILPDNGLKSKFKVGTTHGVTRWDCGSGTQW